MDDENIIRLVRQQEQQQQQPDWRSESIKADRAGHSPSSPMPSSV